MVRSLRVVSGGAGVVSISKAGKADGDVGGWLSTARGSGIVPLHGRDRIGRQAGSALFGVDSSFATGRRNRILNTEQLWTVYQRVPDVRAAVDAITRRVATWDWYVEPALNPASDGYEAALDAAEEVRRWLQAPNEDGETWQELLTKVVTDILVFDAGAMEMAFNRILLDDEETGVVLSVPGEELEEIVALRGGDIRPIVDKYGRVLGYKQDVLSSGSVPVVGVDPLVVADADNSTEPVFLPRQIVYLRLFPNTSSPEGQPLIETILNEITTMLRQAEHIMLQFDADEIPPGILVLTGLKGAAAQAAKTDLQKMRGRDHKIRVVTSADPTATGAKWVELRRTNKDVDFVNVVKEVRRTIWRVLGVQRVEMGDTENMPRAVGEVQLDVSSSHLIGPILELLEGKVNARILPVVAESLGHAGAPIVFRFDRDAKLSPEERDSLANYLTKLVDKGVLTVNEARAEIGQAPYGREGDIPTVSTGAGPVPLTMLVGGAALEPSGGSGEDGGGSPAPGEDDAEEGVEDTEADGAEEGEEAPGEATATRLTVQRLAELWEARLDGLVRAVRVERAKEEELPSDWQPTGRFADVRTLALPKLWEQASAYARAVEPLYDQAQRDAVSVVASRYNPGATDEEAATRMTAEVGQVLDRLEAQWALASEPIYRATGRIGRDAAAQFTGLPVLEDVDERSLRYGQNAMQYLTQAGGLLSDLRASLSGVVAVVTTRAITRPDSDLGSDSSVEDVALATAGVFEAQRHRIRNWSGKLVELSNRMMVDGMSEGNAEAPPAGGGDAPTPTEWYVEWVHVGDERMCPTCSLEGNAGFRPLSVLATVPGGATECRARCRCVLVYWTRSEVDSGTAVPLSGP